jgi:hypothetical protein
MKLHFFSISGVNAACGGPMNIPCSTCDVYNTCGGVQLISFPDLNLIECTTLKIQMQRTAGIDTLGDRTQIAGALQQGGCPLSVEDWIKDEACPVPSGAALAGAKAMLGMSAAPDAAVLPYLGTSCTGDCCQGGSPAATYCGTHTTCASYMVNNIPDSHAMALGCMNNHYVFDRLVNSSQAPTGGPLNGLGTVTLQAVSNMCKSMVTVPAPCMMPTGGLNFGNAAPTCCEAVQVMAAADIMGNATATAAQKANVAFCTAHGANSGGCEADNKTPTSLAVATAQTTIMANSCDCGNTVMAQLTAAEKAIMDKDGDNILDACSTTTTTTTTAAKKKDSSAAGLAVSMTAMASAVLATIF